jgi:hypothetical protein
MRNVLKIVVGAALALTMAACTGGGSGNGGDYSPAPAPPSPPPPPDCSSQWAAAKVVVMTDCANCHNGTSHPALLPQATFDASPVRAQVDSGKMPPAPAVLAAADKATLDTYLTCSGK